MANALRSGILAYAAGVVALMGVRRRVRLPRPATVTLATSVPLAVAVTVPSGRACYAAMWASYMWLFKVAWEAPYDRPEKLRPRLHVDYALRADRAIGAGVAPTVRLQRALRDSPRLTPLDYGLTTVYHALWLAPHAVLGWMLLKHEDRVPRVAGRLAAVYHLTTVGYWLVPTAPPWWTGENGERMVAEVQRVPREVRRAVARRIGLAGHRFQRDDEADWMATANPWGSMPSDAVPAAALTARSLAQISPAAGAAAWAATALQAFALVYLGEHYLVDVIAGLALAEAVWRAEPAVLPLARRGVDALRALRRLTS